DPATGRAQTIFTETSDSWLNLTDNLRPLKDGRLIWSSERDGYSHLYLRIAGKWTQLTSGPWQENDVLGVGEAKGRIYFRANRDTPLEWQVYSVDIARPGAITRLTEAGWTNMVAMDGAARRMIVSRSNPTQPEQVYLADATGKRLRWIEQNALTGAHPYAPYAAAQVKPVFGTLKAADGSDLHYQLLSPAREPGRRYPVLVQVYGGPGAGRQVLNDFVSPLHQYLVGKGWIIFSIDNRGTPDRGKAF